MVTDSCQFSYVNTCIHVYETYTCIVNNCSRQVTVFFSENIRDVFKGII